MLIVHYSDRLPVKSEPAEDPPGPAGAGGARAYPWRLEKLRNSVNTELRRRHQGAARLTLGEVEVLVGGLPESQMYLGEGDSRRPRSVTDVAADIAEAVIRKGRLRGGGRPGPGPSGAGQSGAGQPGAGPSGAGSPGVPAAGPGGPARPLMRPEVPDASLGAGRLAAAARAFRPWAESYLADNPPSGEFDPRLARLAAVWLAASDQAAAAAGAQAAVPDGLAAGLVAGGLELLPLTDGRVGYAGTLPGVDPARLTAVDQPVTLPAAALAYVRPELVGGGDTVFVIDAPARDLAGIAGDEAGQLMVEAGAGLRVAGIFVRPGGRREIRLAAAHAEQAAFDGADRGVPGAAGGPRASRSGR